MTKQKNSQNDQLYAQPSTKNILSITDSR